VDPDAGAVGLPDRGRDAWPGRIEHGGQPGQAQVPFGVLAPTRDGGGGGQRAVGEGEHAQALPRVAGHDPGGLVPVRGGDGKVPAAAADRGAQGQDLFRCPLVSTARPPST
jgi:hypothetical protein